MTALVDSLRTSYGAGKVKLVNSQRMAAAESRLTPRWHRATLDPRQRGYLFSKARNNYVYAGRRSFKTESAKRRVVKGAVGFTAFPNGRFFACAPTHQQAKDIYWEDLKKLTPGWALRYPNDARRSISDGELKIHLRNGAIIQVAGLDRPQRIEGGDWDGGVIDEYADIKPDVVPFHIRPMMTRGGWLDRIGVPEGRNHFYQEIREAEARVLEDPDCDYAVFHWKASEVLHLWLGRAKAEQELLDAQQSMDELSFNQEYNADFIVIEGRAYYAFDRDIHAAETLPYFAHDPLDVQLDFNRSPGVAVISQDARYKGSNRRVSKAADTTFVIGEVYIPRNSNTPKVCRRLIRDWRHHKGLIRVTGDATGGNKNTQSVDGSDWDIVESILRPAFGSRLQMMQERSNPPERSRVNSMNTRLMNARGQVAMLVDPVKCPHVVDDFEGVVVVEGGAGEIDKDNDPNLTHLTDGLGYGIHQRHPMTGPAIVEQIL